MQKAALYLVIMALMLAPCEQMASGTAVASPPSNSGAREKVVAYAIQHEVNSSDILKHKEICIAFGHGLTLDEADILSELQGSGLRVHPDDWCTREARGVNIVIVAPIREPHPQIFQFVVELGDLSPLGNGQHFGTLLKRGTYTIHCGENSEPKLVSYQETCCSAKK